MQAPLFYKNNGAERLAIGNFKFFLFYQFQFCEKYLTVPKDYVIMRKGYRIISIEAADIYRQEQENGVAIGYKLPEKKDDVFYLFKIYLDYSLDLVELEKAYKRICRKKFAFQDKYE